MKRIFKYTLLLLFMMLGVVVNGQVLTDDSEPNGGGGELDGVICKNKDYQFRVQYELDDIIYESAHFTNENVYICTRTLPLELVIINSASNEPIVPFEMVWLKEVIVDGIGGSLSEIGGNLLEITEDDYFEDSVIELNISVRFKLSQLQEPLELELTVLENEVNFTQVNGSNYAYDDNKIESYIGEYFGDLSELNTPWNFLLIGPQDAQGAPIPPESLRGKIEKEKWINFVPEEVIADDNLLVINPAQIAPNREANISFDHDVLTNDKVIKVHSCDKDPELLLYAGGVKTIDIEVFQVCESDDDMRLIPHTTPAPNGNPMAVCISSGADGSLDLARNANFYLSQGDVYHDMSQTIRAGPDGVCGARMFREPPPVIPGDPAGLAGPVTISDCTPLNMFNIQNELSNLNTLSSQVGLNYRVVFSGQVAVNFDVRDENGVISDGQERGFLKIGIEHIAGDIPDNTVSTYLVEDLSTRPNPDPNSDATILVLGEATDFGSSMLSLDVVDADYRTWFHEIGHAFGGLHHPDERDNDGPTEYFLADDKKNFMYSTRVGRTNNVRRYQFRNIRIGL